MLYIIEHSALPNFTGDSAQALLRKIYSNLLTVGMVTWRFWLLALLEQ
jgi:hypothetical protein